MPRRGHSQPDCLGYYVYSVRCELSYPYRLRTSPPNSTLCPSRSRKLTDSSPQWPGGTHHITFAVQARTSFGIRGSYFALFFRVMPAIVWDGIEAWWGAQAIATMIGTWSLRWAAWDYPLAQGTMQLKDLIGFVLYHVVFLAVMWLPPEKLARPFMVSFVGFTITIAGLMIWATHTAGGAGPYFAPDYQAPAVLAGSVGRFEGLRVLGVGV